MRRTIQARIDKRRRIWLVVGGLAVGHSIFHWIVQSFIVTLPEIQDAFGLSAVGVGAILSIRELTSGLISLPGGVVVDLIRRRWGTLLTTCFVASGLGCLIMGVSPFYPVLLIGLVVVTISHSVWHLPSAASLSHHVPDRRALALSFHGVGGGIGDVAGPIVTGALLTLLTWRGILSVYSIVPLSLVFMAAWSFKSIGHSQAAEITTSDPANHVKNIRGLLANRVLWTVALVMGLRAMALVGLLTMLPLYFDRELDLSPFSRGFHVGLLIAVGLVAKLLMGYLSDRWGRKQVLVPGMIWSAALSLLLLFNDQGIGLTITVALLGLFLYPDQPILTAVVLEVVGPEVATTGLGIAGFIEFMMAALSPLIVAGLYEALDVEMAVYYIAALFSLAAAVLMRLPLGTRST